MRSAQQQKSKYAPGLLPTRSQRAIREMAETAKLSVGQVLEKLRGTDVPKLKRKWLDEKIEALNQGTQRLRAASLRLERDQRGGSTGRD